MGDARRGPPGAGARSADASDPANSACAVTRPRSWHPVRPCSIPMCSPSVSRAASPIISGPILLLSDPDRLTRLLCDDTRPVQLVLAGKAHPADEAGKQMI